MTNFGFGKPVEAKLHTMRKPQSFTVQPVSGGEHVIIQSDKSIGRVNIRTGAGVLNVKGSYFPHLSKALGAFDYQFPPEFVAQVLDACPSLDGKTDLGGVIIHHTIQEI